MRFYEFEAKEVLRRARVPLPKSVLARTPEEAEAAAGEVGGALVLKSQVLSGGRMKAGAIKFADDAAGAKGATAEILQIAVNGQLPVGVLVEERRDGVLVSGANGQLRPEHVEASAARIASAAVVLLQLEVAMDTIEAAARLARAGGARVILDPAAAQALSPALLECVDFLTPNQSELAALAGGGAGGDERAAARALS